MTMFVKLLARVGGIALLVLGIVGFAMSSFAGLSFDTTQNILHIVLGVLLFAAAGTYGRARMLLILTGILFAVAAVAALVMNGNVFGFFAVNTTEIGLYVGIAFLCLIVGFGSKSKV
jgi:hypothetical protein